MKKRLSVLAILVGLAVAIYFLFLHKPAPIRVVERVIQEFEREQAAEVMSFFSQSYRDDYGYTFSNLGGRLRQTFEGLDEPAVIVDEKKLEYPDGQPEKAIAQVKFKLVATVEGIRGYLIGNLTEAATAEVELVREKDGWKVQKVTLHNVGVPIPRGETDGGR